MEIAPRKPKEEGRIPFRVRIGVTGHRALEDEEELAALVRDQVHHIVGLLKSKGTSITLSVVSQLADGADRLVVREVMAVAAARGEQARLECFLPLPREEYVQVQGFDAESRAEFDEMLRWPAVVREPAEGAVHASHAEAYRSAGHLLVGRCDVLIAIWDGLPPRGRGGTAETVVYAAARSKPCIWIEAGSEHAVHHNLGSSGGRPFFEGVAARAALEPPIDWSESDHPVTTLDSTRSELHSLDEFNRESLPSDFKSTLERQQGSVDGVADWVAPEYARATTLARRWRGRFHWTARLITFLAALGAVMLGMGLSYGEGAEIWAWAEAGTFALALLGLIIVRNGEFHRRWLFSRVLAEHLRSAHFLALTQADFRRQARLEPVYTGKESTAWLMRAFEEAWDRRPHPPSPTHLGAEELRRLKELLADNWVGEQIAYHQDKEKKHRLWHKALTRMVLLLFVGTVVFAVLHALHELEHLPVLMSVALPAAGASLGVLLTVNQHHALSERSARMKTDLAVVQRDLRDAPADSLDKVSSDAARAIAQENAAWFGSMWFLDIEHP